jgi:hypothetical protein
MLRSNLKPHHSRTEAINQPTLQALPSTLEQPTGVKVKQVAIAQTSTAEAPRARAEAGPRPNRQCSARWCVAQASRWLRTAAASHEKIYVPLAL